jgi:hypothetical protein
MASAQEWPPLDDAPISSDGFRQTAWESLRWRDDTWEATHRQHLSYDEAGRLAEIDHQSWFNDELRTSRKELFTYDDNVLTEKLTKESVANRLDNRGREIYTYDGEGRLVEKTLLGWSYEQKWAPLFKYVYAYDAAGRRVQERKETLNKELAQPEGQISYEYKDDGTLDAELKYREQAGEWMVAQRFDYRYNDAGQLVEKALQATRTESASWTDMLQVQYAYDDDGLCTNATSKFRGATDGFEDKMRRLFEYDEHGNQIAVIFQTLQEDDWQDGRKEVYRYEQIPAN